MNQPLDIYYEKCPVMYISDTVIVFLKFVVIVANVARFLSIIQNLVIAYLLLYDNGRVTLKCAKDSFSRQRSSFREKDYPKVRKGLFIYKKYHIW